MLPTLCFLPAIGSPMAEVEAGRAANRNEGCDVWCGILGINFFVCLCYVMLRASV